MKKVPCPNCKSYKNKILPPKTVIGIIGFVLFAIGFILLFIGIIFFPLWIVAVPLIIVGGLMANLPQIAGISPHHIECKSCCFRWEENLM